MKKNNNSILVFSETVVFPLHYLTVYPFNPPASTNTHPPSPSHSTKRPPQPVRKEEGGVTLQLGESLHLVVESKGSGTLNW